MSWVTPKTDWHGGVNSDGIYEGDRFDYEDFNRIKNNIEYLRNMAVALYESFDIDSLGSDRSPSDYFYADEINTLESNFKKINSNTISKWYGLAPTYYDNGNTMDYVELNRLEGAILDLHNLLANMYEGRRMFTWNFGTKGGVL